MDAPSLRVSPFQPAGLDSFCRLFPPLDREETFDAETMTKLGRSMRPVKLENVPQARTPAVAYTYFGQFIDHDLTRDETRLHDAGLTEPRETTNHAGGRLELGHLYGEGPGSTLDGKLYEEDGASFRLGEVRSPLTGVRFDLPLENGEPIAADYRTPENLILRQLSVMFMRLHNIAVQNESGSAGKRFRAARQRVVWQYQWLVRKHFLGRMLHPAVYPEVISDEGRVIDWNDRFSIPVEFSQAAFRFGHSMVRDFYILRPGLLVPLKNIFTGPERKRGLAQGEAIDWAIMTDGGGQRTKAIDPIVTLPLFDLQGARCHQQPEAPDCPLPLELTVRTLQRGAATRLPTGEQVAAALGHPAFNELPNSSTAMYALGKLAEYGLSGKTPLWYYILLEAEVESAGNRLGTIGSRIVGEVIEGSLRTDPDSYVSRCGSAWDPPEWSSPFLRTTITDLRGAALVSGLYRIRRK